MYSQCQQIVLFLLWRRQNQRFSHKSELFKPSYLPDTCVYFGMFQKIALSVSYESDFTQTKNVNIVKFTILSSFFVHKMIWNLFTLWIYSHCTLCEVRSKKRAQKEVSTRILPQGSRNSTYRKKEKPCLTQCSKITFRQVLFRPYYSKQQFLDFRNVIFNTFGPFPSCVAQIWATFLVDNQTDLRSPP